MAEIHLNFVWQYEFKMGIQGADGIVVLLFQALLKSANLISFAINDIIRLNWLRVNRSYSHCAFTLKRKFNR